MDMRRQDLNRHCVSTQRLELLETALHWGCLTASNSWSNCQKALGCICTDLHCMVTCFVPSPRYYLNLYCPPSELSLLKSSQANTYWRPCRSAAFWIKTIMNFWWCKFITVHVPVFLSSPLQICAGWQLASWAWLWPSSSLVGLLGCWGAVGIEALCSMWQGFSSSWEVRILFEEMCLPCFHIPPFHMSHLF